MPPRKQPDVKGKVKSEPLDEDKLASDEAAAASLFASMGDAGDLFNPAKRHQEIRTAEDKWALVPAFLKLHGLVRQHIDSFDHFVNTGMQDIVAANCRVESDNDPKFYLKYNRVWIGEPRVELKQVPENLRPQTCRLRDLTYSAPIYVDVEYVRNKRVVVREGLAIGQMPIMLRSSKCVLLGLSDQALTMAGECPLDPGGYFIVKGTEKVVLIQEQLSKNRIIIERDSKNCLAASCTSSADHFKSRFQIVELKTGELVGRHNNFAEDINALVLLRAMGMASEAEAAAAIGGELLPALEPTLAAAARHAVRSTSEALEYVGMRMKIPPQYRGRGRARAAEARQTLTAVLLGHVPAPHHDLRHKAAYVALMMRRVLLASVGGGGGEADRDYYGNKRLELAGQLLALLFEDLFKQFNSHLKKTIDKTLEKMHRATQFDALKLMRTDLITHGLTNAISTGNWVVKRFKMERAGVTAVLSRLSYIASLGMMTRITSQFEKTRKISGPRALQPSQIGMLCPADTPEGESCGLVKNLALLTHVTTDSDDAPLRRVAVNLGVQPLLVAGAAISTGGAHLVLINGNILGVHNRPKRLARAIRRLRRAGMVGPFVSVHIDDDVRAVNIASDSGRLCRPLIVCDRGVPRLTPAHVDAIKEGTMSFADLLASGIVEFVDVNEENDIRIAMDESMLEPACSHLEIAPYTLLGVVAGLIPYPHHNQSPRNTYQCAMGKQAMGAIAFNQQQRIDTVLYLLSYPQKPMVKTRTIELIRFDELPAGQNACIAVMSFSGFDIEDALVLNRASIDRGFGRCAVMRKLVGAAKKYPNQSSDLFEFPTSDTVMTYSSQCNLRETLDRDGIAHPGVRLKNGDVAWNKKTPLETSHQIDNLANVTLRDGLQKHRGPQDVIVDQVLITSNQDDHWLVKMLLRGTRRPELGDKFSSRHGQKGVVGMIANARDMPFSDRGMVPDIIMNPHGFPSRMTVGKMIELVAGKSGVLDGKLKYGTAFAGDKAAECGRRLIAHGYAYSGKEMLTSGITGETLPSYVFCGPVFYQKLKHMVKDKMHARSTGPKAVLTRQPTEGRSRGGGLRLGEMERDCLIAYGASNLLIERLMISSDQFNGHACKECGFLASAGWCQHCKSTVNVVELRLPYACKLLFQELLSMGIVPKLVLD